MKLAPDQKLAGVLCPAFAIRTENDLGIGDTAGVRELIDWCHRHGLSVLQLLPINETSDDNSPYNAISAMALEPSTIALTPSAPAAGPVDYRKVKALKRRLLEDSYRVFKPTKSFRDFVKANAPWLPDYTLFRTLMDEHGGSANWESWPAEHQTPAQARAWLAALPAARRQALETRQEFFAYVQWIAYDQWTSLKAHGTKKNVALMGDIPFGVSRYSADVWAHREIFDLEWSGGAPPEPAFGGDDFTRKWGQNWGIPLYRWDVLRKQKYAWWKLRVGSVQEVFHIFRIDHVLGFYRIFAFPWEPQRNWEFAALDEAGAKQKTGGRLPRFFPEPDGTPEQQAINCRQGEELLKMVKAAAGQTVVIAEDLGVVPPYVRPSLLKLEIPGFKIPHWERNPDYTYVDGARYPRLSISTPATHDHDPLAALWRRLWRDHEDARTRQDHQAAHVTWLELQRFMWWLGDAGENIPREFTPELHERYCRRLLATNSWLAMLMITDIFAQETRFNVPGSVGGSNWSARLERTVAELDRDPKIEMFARLVKESQRRP